MTLTEVLARLEKAKNWDPLLVHGPEHPTHIALYAGHKGNSIGTHYLAQVQERLPHLCRVRDGFSITLHTDSLVLVGDDIYRYLGSDSEQHFPPDVAPFIAIIEAYGRKQAALRMKTLGWYAQREEGKKLKEDAEKAEAKAKRIEMDAVEGLKKLHPLKSIAFFYRELGLDW